MRLACPLPPPTVLISFQFVILVKLLLPQLSTQHISLACAPPVCTRQSLLAALFPSASSLLDHANKLFAPLPSHIKSFFFTSAPAWPDYVSDDRYPLSFR